MSKEESPHSYTLIESAIRFAIEQRHRQPSLEEMAEAINLSPFHFQRIFSEWAGISPKKFVQYLTLEALKSRLIESSSIAEAAELVGLSSPSRVHDLFVTLESVTPFEYKTMGKNLEIRYGFYPSPFGECLIAETSRGICALLFVTSSREAAVQDLSVRWEKARLSLQKDPERDLAAQIFNPVRNPEERARLRVFVKGTHFQTKVWEALLKIPNGNLTSYQHIADSIGNPGAVRAVGTAIGANPVSWLIPCHRVIRREGVVGQYYWGSLRKAAIIGWEAPNYTQTELGDG